MLAGTYQPIFWVFLLTLVTCGALYFAVDRGNRPMQRRLQDLAIRFRNGDTHENLDPAAAGLGATFQEWAERVVPAPNLDKPSVEKLVLTLQYAGFYGSAAPKVFQALRILSTVAGAFLGYTAGALLGRPAVLFGFLVAGVGWSLPSFFLRSMANSRQTRIRREIPDVIDLLVVCAECGLGLMASIRIVGRECERQDRLIGGQLALASAELSAGSTLGESMRAIAQRTGVEEIRSFSAILVQSEKLGTDMAQALRATADQLRISRTMRAEEMAQKLPIKMVFPMVFLLLPALMIILTGPALIMFFRVFDFR
jgi:tight adherence protein C